MKKHILIVEENNDLRDELRVLLEEEFIVSVAEDTKTVWELIRKNMPDLVISEVILSNLDGIELCRLVKSTHETAHIPFILLTTLSDKANRLLGYAAGADNYITKPFDTEVFPCQIRSIIKNREIIIEKALKLLNLTHKAALNNEINDKFLKKASDVVRTNLTTPDFGKDKFASAMHVSSSLLYKRIKAITSLSPIEYITFIRMNYALELLQTQQYTITEVSELSGFSRVGYFSMVFKKHFGKQHSEMFK
jgi:DNA-binding response OmpR family regulator